MAYPLTMSVRLQNLLKLMIMPFPEERLCYRDSNLRDVKSHAYFKEFDWAGADAPIIFALSRI